MHKESSRKHNSNNHGLATFVNKRLEWPLVDPSGGSCQLHRLVALQLQGVENNQQTYWQAWTLLSPVPRLNKFHCLATREELGTQDWWLRVHQACQQTAVWPMEDSNTWGSQYLRTLQARRVWCCPHTPEARKVSGIGFYLPRVYTPHRVGSQILVLRLPHFLHAPTQNSNDLEKWTNSCDPKARTTTGGRKELPSNRSSTHCSHRRRRALQTGGRPWTRPPCWHRTSRTAFRLKRRSEPCWSTSQQPRILYGTTASPASWCNCCLTDTWSPWSWRWLAIAFTLTTGNGKRSTLRRLKNGVPQGFVLAPLLFNIYISDSQPPSPDSKHMLTILQWCMVM